MSRSDLLSFDDDRLVQHAASVIGVPRAEVLDGRFSFVLHAPLELLARAALLPLVAPERRDAARARIVVLADGYVASGPSRPAARPADFDEPSSAAARLADAAAAGDRDAVDAAATWLGERCTPVELTALLADFVLPSLEAAGHGNIYLALLHRYRPRGAAGQMLRHVADALVADAPRSISMPPTRVEDDPGLPAALLGRIAGVRSVGPPDSDFIAPMVQHAERRGAFATLVDDGVFVAPRRPPFELLRFASQAMLQGPAEQAPYGWTHCLTLAEAPLLMATAGADLGRATFVAAAYLAAHWAIHGEGAVDLEHVPARNDVPLTEALTASPEIAAGAAWHAGDPGEVASLLATVASSNHDAHRVKYTLACLDAAACDPGAARLHLAAAAHLNAWWDVRGDETDPRPDLVTATPSSATIVGELAGATRGAPILS